MKLTVKPSEHEIQNSIIEYLKLKKWYVMRLNSGNMTKEYNGKKYFIRGQEPGTPDLMAFKINKNISDDLITPINLLFIEVKRPGAHPTVLQIAKMNELEQAGAKCIVATNVEDLQKLDI